MDSEHQNRTITGQVWTNSLNQACNKWMQGSYDVVTVDSVTNTSTHSTHADDEGVRTTNSFNQACNKWMQDSYDGVTVDSVNDTPTHPTHVDEEGVRAINGFNEACNKWIQGSTMS